MKRKYVAQPAVCDANGMINLPGLGLVALPKPGDRGGRDDDDDDEANSDSEKPRKKAKRGSAAKAPGSSAKGKKADTMMGVDGVDGDDDSVLPASGKKKMTKRQEAASASKASAKKTVARKEPGSAPAKSRAGRKANSTSTAAAPRTSTRPQRANASQKSWANLNAETETEEDEDEEDGEDMNTSPLLHRHGHSSDGASSGDEDAEMLETVVQASRRGVHARRRRNAADGEDSEESESDRELAPVQLLPATPAHHRSGTSTSFLATPQLRTPARTGGRASISPGLLGGAGTGLGHHLNMSMHHGNGHDVNVHGGVNSTPLRLSSPSAALSLASPSTQLMSPGVHVNVFSPSISGPSSHRLRPLSTPLTNQHARFHNMMAPRTPASPSHGLHLHPSSAINSMMSHLTSSNNAVGGTSSAANSGVQATPSSRMLSMSMGLHLMSSPGPASSYLNTPGGAQANGQQGVGHDDALSSSNVGGVPLQRDSEEDGGHMENGASLSKSKANPLSSLSSPSPFINLSTRPLLQTPLLRYGLQTPSGFNSNGGAAGTPGGFNGTGVGSHVTGHSAAGALPIPGSAASPGFESFFQSPVRMLHRTSSSQRGKRGLDFPAEENNAGEVFLNSPPPLHAQAPLDVTAPASSTPPAVSPTSSANKQLKSSTAQGMGAASVQQLLSHLQNQAASSMDPSTPSSVSMPALTTSPAVAATPSTASTIRTDGALSSGTPALPNLTTPLDADAPLPHSSSGVADSIPRFDQSEIDKEVVEPKHKSVAPSTPATPAPVTPAQKKRSTRRTQEIQGSPLLAFATLC